MQCLHQIVRNWWEIQNPFILYHLRYIISRLFVLMQIISITKRPFKTKELKNNLKKVESYMLTWSQNGGSALIF